MKKHKKSSSPFRGLKRALEEKQNQRERLREARKRSRCETAGPADPDDEIFSNAMVGVREIPGFRALPCPEPPRLKIRRSRTPEDQDAEMAMHELGRIVDHRSGITLSDTDEYMQWAAPSLLPHKRQALTRGLHEGRYSVEDFIDLHGLTEDEAWHGLLEFMRDVRWRKLSCIKIIHGRGLRSPGEPVLKGAVRRWLEGPMSMYVIAYATARACDGGLGATYVLLRR